MKKLISMVSTAGLLVASFAFFANVAPAAADTIVVVTPANTQGWSTADTNAGGTVNFITDTSSPAPSGALQLATDTTTTAKAQYVHESNVPLADVSGLSYSTKQNAPAGIVADPSYQLITFLNGGTSGFTTLVFEPYQNPGNNGNPTIVPGTWQQWDVSNGLFWSTRTVTCSNGTIVGTPGGPSSYTLAQIESTCPDSVVAAFGVNIGSNNPAYNVETDLVSFNGTTYNFEVTNAPTSKDQCKDGNWQNLTDSQGQSFRNQGDCVSFVATNGRNTASGR
ncbi:MAG TPA: hypothetical protein VFX17_00080 [Patescibacteria group bacterium]|nr:hypothetical protein [Patescibacteria group bacterium]